MRYAGFVLALLFLCTASLAWGEEMHLKDGNVIKGSFQRLEGGNILFKTSSMGTLTVPVANVESFTSESKVVVVLKSGKIAEGTFSVTKTGGWQLQTATGVATLQPGDVLAAYPTDTYMKQNPSGRRAPWRDWKGSGSLGYVVQESSQHSASFSTGFNAARTEPKLEGLPPRRRSSLSFNMAFINLTNAAGVKTSDNTLNSFARQDFFFGGEASNFLFVEGAFDHIESQQLSLRQTYGGGLGRDLIRRPRFTMSIRGGLTYVRTSFETGELRNDMEALAGEKVTLTIFKHLNLNHAFDVYPNLTSAGNYRFDTITTLSLPIYHRFSFQISLTDNFLSNPIPGTERNNLIMSTGLGINF
jgi:hypothetical protein